MKLSIDIMSSYTIKNTVASFLSILCLLFYFMFVLDFNIHNIRQTVFCNTKKGLNVKMKHLSDWLLSVHLSHKYDWLII